MVLDNYKRMTILVILMSLYARYSLWALLPPDPEQDHSRLLSFVPHT